MSGSPGSHLLPLFLLLICFLGAALSQTVCSANRSEIEENKPPGTFVTTIFAGPDITVIIDPADKNGDMFEINGTELILKQSLDYEAVQLITLQLLCRRGDVTAANLRVILTILNVNDEPPVFPVTFLAISIQEDTKVGTSIGSLYARDADGDIIYYDMMGSSLDATSHFKLAGVDSPIIQVSRALDYDKFTHAQLILYARDTLETNATISHTATATINVTIMDVDNKDPWFLPCRFLDVNKKICHCDGYKVNVTRSEQAADALVLSPGPLYAIDGDWGINEAITYEILSGNKENIFAVGNMSGNLTMQKPADVLGTIVLIVMASQVSNPRHSTTIVNIEVVEKNDHRPTFSSTNYMGTLPAYSVPGSLVMDYNSRSRPLKIFAVDDDFPDKKNPAITYSIQNSSEFSISQDGFIESSAELNSSTTIVMLVVAFDRASGDGATTLVSVEVTPVTGAETTTIAPTTARTTTGIGTTTQIPPGFTSPTPPLGTVTGTTKMPPEMTTGSSHTGSSTTGITNRPPGPTTTSPETRTVSATTISGTPGNPSVTISGLTPPVSSLSPTKPTTSSLPLGSTITKQPATGTGPTESRTTNALQPGTSSTTTSVTRVTSPPSAGPSDSRTTNIHQPGTGSTGKTTITVPISVTPPGSGTTKPTGPTTSSATKATPEQGTIQPSATGTRPASGMTTTTATHSKPAGTGTTKPSPTVTGPTAGMESSAMTSPQTERPVVNNELQYSAADMAAVGASLAALLLICIAFLGFFIHKQYGYKLKKMSEMDGDSGSNGSHEGRRNLIDNEQVESTNSDPNEAGDDGAILNLNFNSSETTTDASSTSGSNVLRTTDDGLLPPTFPAPFTTVDGLEGVEDEDVDSDKEVKSILTKERRVNDESYKAVWFKGDIEPDEVVMINEHEPAGEGQGDEEEEETDNESDDGEDNYGDGGYNQAPTVAFSSSDVTADTDQSTNTIL